MNTRFAQLEARSVAAALKHVANAVATVQATGAQVAVVFDERYQPGLGSVFESSMPSALGASADLQALEHGSALQIHAQTWHVAGIEPDGAGMTRLMLERAP